MLKILFFQICILSLVALIIGVAAPRVNAQCTGDVIPSGIIDGVDLAQTLSSWGPCANCPADIDSDGAVTGIDLGPQLERVCAKSTPSMIPLGMTSPVHCAFTLGAATPMINATSERMQI